jgi:hypothetical protein
MTSGDIVWPDETPKSTQPNADALGLENVGDFRQGNPISQWALARYLVGRVIAERIRAGLLLTGLIILVLAALVYWFGPTWLAVLIVIVALFVFLARKIVTALIAQFTAAAVFRPIEDRMRALVADTHGDFRRELKRVGIPSSWWTFPVLVLRLVFRRRQTFERMRTFDIARVVPKIRLDELHLLVRSLRSQP